MFVFFTLYLFILFFSSPEEVKTIPRIKRRRKHFKHKNEPHPEKIPELDASQKEQILESGTTKIKIKYELLLHIYMYNYFLT